MFVIEDELHSESTGEFETLKDAIDELHRLSKIPWDEEPNKAPCISWMTCGRHYEIIEYDNSTKPWKEVNRINGFEIRAIGIKCNKELL